MKDKGIPDLFIEKLLLDELPQSEKERLLMDPSVQRRLEELKAENRRILEEYPPEEMAKAIRNRSRWSQQTEAAQTAQSRRQSKRPGRLRLSRLIPAASFALLVLVGGLLLITRGPGFFAPQGQDAETRLKGGAAHINVYMKIEAGARLGLDQRLGVAALARADAAENQGDRGQVRHVPPSGGASGA